MLFVEQDQLRNNNTIPHPCLEVFQVLSSNEIIKAKTDVAIGYWSLKDRSKKAIFETGTLKQESNFLKTAFDKSGILFGLGLLDKQSFLKTYDGNIARAWKLLKDDIEYDRITNPKQCENFEKMALEIINIWESSHNASVSLPEPYRPKDENFRESTLA